MSKPQDEARTAAWSSYWSQGALHSCATSFGANYAGAIGAFWRSTLADLRPGDRILDLATGNGPLPLMLWEQHGPEAGLEIDAVDLAEVAPGWFRPSEHAGIRFHAGVAMENLPFSDDGFDWVISQFGVEYARRPDSLHECLRVLQRDGTVAFVLHHAGSVLATVAKIEVVNLELLLGPDGLIDKARQVIPWLAQARANPSAASNNPQATQCRSGYNEAMARLAGEIESCAVPDVLVGARQWVHALLSGAEGTDPDRQLQALDRYRASLQAALLRSAELVDHALDEVQVREFLDVLVADHSGATVRCEPIEQSEGILGWGLVVAFGGDAGARAATAAL